MLARLVILCAVAASGLVPGPGSSAPVAGRPVASVVRAGVVAVAAGTRSPNYVAPVSPVRVVRAFEAPPSPYAAGHRGVDLATRPGQVVVSAGDGAVRFAGVVAGRGVVVVAHPDGISTEYEPLRVEVAAGDHVAAGAPLGVVAGSHGACAPGSCLHWGARRGATYVDPLALLRPLGVVRLLPWTGDP